MQQGSPEKLSTYFCPHDVWQWGRERVRLELQPRIRSGANLCSRCCYFVKSKYPHFLHHRLLIHLPCPHCNGKSNRRERQAVIEDGGVRIKDASSLQQLTTSTMNNVRKNHLTALVWDLLAMCNLIHNQFLNQQEGMYDSRVDAIMQDQMDDRV